MKDLDTKKLVHWFKERKRDLPWRHSPTPYRVWVSEVMLQQTQVAVVIPYFLRWMERFPTIEALAEAETDAVIKEWEGLGYYSRARNLQSGARYVVESYGGSLPDSAEELATIKGLGPYTVAAIRSFAFHKKAAPLDGNVIRVLTRLLAIEDDISKPATLKKLRTIADALLPDEEPWTAAEALIELGATTCVRNPRCSLCPLKHQCRALVEGKTSQLPFKSARQKTTFLFRAVPIIRYKDHVLIQKGAPGKLMADLHEFPYFETAPEGIDDRQLEEVIKSTYHLEASLIYPLAAATHTFTRFKATLMPRLLEAQTIEGMIMPEGFFWHPEAALRQLPFSSGHLRIVEELGKKTRMFMLPAAGR